MLGTIVPSIAISQNKNRISIQTGLFHTFFDGTAIMNSGPTNPSKRIYNYKILSNLLRGTLNDSRGIQFQRMINNKSSISAEYMALNTSYDYEEVFNSTVKPVVVSRQIKYFNISYTRKLNLSDKFDFVYGGGVNYLWGIETIYHYTYLTGWGGEPRTYSYYRNDVGLNLRTGIEYSPLKWLTLYTNFDFIGIIHLGAKDIDGNNSEDFYKEKFDLKNVPSRYDLSWRFGLGFNF